MSIATKTLTKFFFDRSFDETFTAVDYTDSAWGGTESQLAELVVEGYIERPLGSRYVLTPSGRSLIGASWNRS